MSLRILSFDFKVSLKMSAHHVQPRWTCLCAAAYGRDMVREWWLVLHSPPICISRQDGA